MWFVCLFVYYLCNIVWNIVCLFVCELFVICVWFVCRVKTSSFITGKPKKQTIIFQIKAKLLQNRVQIFVNRCAQCNQAEKQDPSKCMKISKNTLVMYELLKNDHCWK